MGGRGWGLGTLALLSSKCPGAWGALYDEGSSTALTMRETVLDYELFIDHRGE